MRHIKLVIPVLLFFVSCGGGTNATKGYNDRKEVIFKDLDLSLDESRIKKIDNLSKLNLKINILNKEKYLLFTNTSNKEYNIKLTQDNHIEKFYKNRDKNLSMKQVNKEHAPPYIMNFNHKLVNTSTRALKEYNIYKKDSLNSKKLFYLEKDNSISTKATAKKIVKNINTKYGNKTLNIWVSDDSFGDNCAKSYCLQEYMLDELAKSFLKEGEDNDIYDWVTNIFGEEWDKTNNSNLINKSDEITILLTDIDNDNRVASGMLGYFYAKDNYKKSIYKGSNERVMFYIDSVLFASHYGRDNWSIENHQTKKILSTLAHEFEHMIQFYQKNVLQKNDGLKPWIDEMLAVSTEDIIATKLKTRGIRGVSYIRGDAGDNNNQYGRFPLFNKIINQTLPTWDNRLKDYAMVSSFGGYLMRNYGGAKLLHDILHNKYNDEKAIVSATKQSPNGVDKNFDTLLQDWGIAVLLSSRTDLDVDSGYLYNSGDFIETDYKDSSYSLGSIDFFKYYIKPNIVTTIHKIAPKSNLYYKIPNNSTETISIKIDKNPNIKMAIIYK